MAEFQEVMKIQNRICEYYEDCSECPLSINNNGSEHSCDYFRIRYPQQAEEKIMNWAKEHPIKTNADKFEEVFGTLFDGICNDIPCDGKCDNCALYNFIIQEYKEPKGE